MGGLCHEEIVPMIAIVKPCTSQSHARFLVLLPAIREQAQLDDAAWLGSRAQKKGQIASRYSAFRSRLGFSALPIARGDSAKTTSRAGILTQHQEISANVEFVMIGGILQKGKQGLEICTVF